MNRRLQKTCFINARDIIQDELEKLYNPREIEIFQDIRLSNFLERQRNEHIPFDQEVENNTALRKALNSIDPKAWYVQMPTDSSRLLMMKSLVALKTFLFLFATSFGLSVTTACRSVFWFRDRRHLILSLPLPHNFFDSLIGTHLSVQQIQFVARRFVQLTGAHWDYSCLAEIEKLLPNA